MNPSNLTQEIVNIGSVLQNNTVGIVLGDRLNLDTAAAGLSLYLSLQDAGKDPQIISKKEPFVEISNLVGINKLKKSFSGDSGKVVVSLPYNRGEVGKVSYKEENDRINFYLTAAEGKSISYYETNDINLIWEGAMPSVIIALGMSNGSQLAEYIPENNSVKVINIDTMGEKFGDISIVDQSFSSVSEIVAKLIKDIRLPMNIDIAQNLLDGILYGTRNFTKPNSSAYAFESAGVMMQMGAQRSDNRNVGRGAFQNRQQSQKRERGQQRHSQGQDQNRPYRDDSRRVEDRKEKRQMSAPREEVMNGSSEQNREEIPSDWLMPKVFTGSQDIEDLK